MNKNSLLLLALVVVLVVVAYVLMQRPGELSTSPSGGDSVVHIDSANVDRITITSPALSLVLAKQGAEWRVESPLAARANQNAVATFLGEANTSTITAMISDKAEKHSIFQVDSTGIDVRFFRRGAENAGLIIGKPGPNYGNVYARRVNSNEVFLIDGAISRSAGKSLKDWRDKTITSIPRENIRDIQFQYGDTAFVLSRNDSAWTIDGRTAEENIVSSLIGSLSQLQADDFIDTLPTQPPLVATLTFAGVHLRFLQSAGSEKYVVQSSSSPQLFELQSWRAQQVLKRKKDLLKIPS